MVHKDQCNYANYDPLSRFFPFLFFFSLQLHISHLVKTRSPITQHKRNNMRSIQIQSLNCVKELIKSN
uniref:Uncharacterized protein n=1 Tax=Rhizophora mucronata TaxID=61149 RepID=A0A2P2MH73_RHIMU